jgi:hypothetical protein
MRHDTPWIFFVLWEPTPVGDGLQGVGSYKNDPLRVVQGLKESDRQGPSHFMT